ncbi:unnamed protein product [Prunus armeniaca]
MNSRKGEGEMRGKTRAIGTIPMIFYKYKESSKADGLGAVDFMGLMEGMEFVGTDLLGSAEVILPSLETAPIIEPASISKCCIKKGLFLVVPLFFQYPYSISKGWSEWVDRELLDPSTQDILCRAQVLDAIFLSKL